MDMNRPGDKERCLELMARVCQLGRLLPGEDELLANPLSRADAELVLAEMAEARAEILEIVSRNAVTPCPPREWRN